MKAFYAFLFALLIAAFANAAPVLRSLKSCSAGCTATYTTCIRAPVADKPACLTTKKACLTTCKSGVRLLEDTEDDAKSICVEACAASKTTCMSILKGKAKKTCVPTFKTCKASC